MRRLVGLAVMLVGVASGTTNAAERLAARIGAEEIRCTAFEARDARTCALELLREIRARAEQRYIDAHELHATADEIAALRAYEHSFARHDRSQRARKLTEIEARLVHMGAEMGAAERERLIEFHTVLQRLAEYEADVARGVKTALEVPTATLAHWIEQTKLDAALYQRYGGTVGLKAAGAYAHSARATLAAEYMRRESVEVADAEIAHHLRSALWAPPPIAFHGSSPDFTPFWLRPLVSSYVGP
jgi:hypothetical protein